MIRTALGAAFLLASAAQVGATVCGHPAVRFIDSVPIADKKRGFTEPSGLSLSDEPGSLLSVSDDTAALFSLTFDGKHLRGLDPEIEHRDLEGIALDPAGKRILTVSEKAAALQVIDFDTQTSREIALADMRGYELVRPAFEKSDPNDRLEGIAIDTARDRIFLLKEKRPRLLLEVSSDLSEIRRVTELTPALGFVDDDQPDRHLDVSGATVDVATGCLWIVSDRGERLFLFDPRSDTAARSYALGWLDGNKARGILHAEGIAHDPATDRLFVINDDGKSSRLFTFEILRDGVTR